MLVTRLITGSAAGGELLLCTEYICRETALAMKKIKFPMICVYSTEYSLASIRLS